MKRLSACALALALSLPGVAWAQVATGNIYGTVADESRAMMPGAVVKLSGARTGSSTTTDNQGNYRFLNLDPGTYTLGVSLTGFATLTREVIVNAGSNVAIDFRLQVATVEENIIVRAETPVLDTKKTGTSTNFSQDELAKVPNSRDPWALLRTVPGVIMDRVNIAGNESGQQSNFAAKGSLRRDAVWSLDGINISDMAATGASPTYFDYDAFEEINVATGANDIRQPTGGVGLNFVSKRGTNSFHGTARGYYTHDDLESSNVPGELADPDPRFRAAGVRPTTAATANHISQIADYGFDLGGPIVRDKLWFWGSYGKQDIRLVRTQGLSIDRTILIDYNVKLNWQATANDMFSIMWFRGAKQKYGRLTGNCAGCVEAPSATWNQDDHYPEEGGPFNLGLPGLWKVENNHVFNPNLYLNVKYAYYGTGFKLESVGPMDQQGGISARLGQTFGSAQSLYFLRPQHTANADANWFANGLGGNHEVKFGVGWRQADGDSQTLWPGDKVQARDNSATDKRARLYREGNGGNRAKYLSLYLGDTYTRDRLTLNLGVRYDRQWGEAKASNAGPNDAFPNLVPGIQFPGYESPFTWKDITPRVGLTYALDDSRRTLLRASFARYASQLATGDIGYMNTTAAVGFVEYRWTDLNGDQLVQPNEVNTGAVLSSGGGFNPANPTAAGSANRIDPNLKAPLSTELIVGFDREIAANFGVSLSYSYRRNTRDFAEPFVGLTAADYTPGTPVTGTLPDGTRYTVPIFVGNAAKVTANGNGTLLTNRADYGQNYHGLEFAAVKRLSNKWMMRAAASWFNHTEDFDGTPNPYFGNPTRLDTDPLVQGGEVPIRSTGSGSGDIFYNAKWAVNVNGMYQLPWNMEIAGNVFGRQGASFPFFRQTVLGTQGSFRVLVSPEVDTDRFENVWNVDLRLAKNAKLGNANLVVTADLFNVFNNNVVLNRQRNASSALFQYATDNLSPRVLRIGMRLGF